MASIGRYWPVKPILASWDTIGQLGQKWPVYSIFASQASIGQLWNYWPVKSVKPVLASLNSIGQSCLGIQSGQSSQLGQYWPVWLVKPVGTVLANQVSISQLSHNWPVSGQYRPVLASQHRVGQSSQLGQYWPVWLVKPVETVLANQVSISQWCHN